MIVKWLLCCGDFYTLEPVINYLKGKDIHYNNMSGKLIVKSLSRIKVQTFNPKHFHSKIQNIGSTVTYICKLMVVFLNLSHHQCNCSTAKLYTNRLQFRTQRSFLYPLLCFGNFCFLYCAGEMSSRDNFGL